MKSLCGKMDYICAYSDICSLMKFDINNVSILPITIRENIYMVLVDLQSHKNTKKILKDLNNCYPFPKDNISTKVHEAFGVDSEKILDASLDAIIKGDNYLLGKLMTVSHKIFINKIIPASKALASPKLISVLSDPLVKSFIFGGKGIGSQGDGSIQMTAKDIEAQKKLVEYINQKYNNYNAFPITLLKDKQ